MSHPTIRQLQYFLTAARLGTFSAAAAEHHIAQPSLSEQISVLETSLGLKLFSRTSRRLLLTDVGKQLVPLAEKTLADAGEIADFGRRVRSLEEGTVLFGTFNSAHLYLLTDLIREFHARYPAVRVKVTGLNSSEVAESVRAGDLEAGIVQLPIDDRQLQLTPGVFVDHVVYVSRNPEHTRTPIDITTLATRPLILSEARWSQDDPLRVSLLERAQAAGVRLEPIIEVEFQTHALELAAQGVGDSLVSYHVGRSVIAERGLYMAPLVPSVEEHYAFVTRRTGSISPATAAFMTLARQILARLGAPETG
ncbi:MAG: LysR family transcriptional regulator [Microbacterium sp.]|uniref:LysR family transcriptional regulator n=1 Tax=Microbacterium sp. TaxID=51671 RepID=UPI001ACE452E|nr:LysR family transcriptional regulator [Microbacterium sp.]MBN9176640.1 LysR family transcriptional regulator [Microbacterium sp.]